MLRKVDLQVWENDIPPAVRVKQRITLDTIQQVLSDPNAGLPTIGIPVVYERDQIQSGGLFNKQVQDCLVVKNADHLTDYFHFVFTVRTTGALSTIEIYYTGNSPNSRQANIKDARQKSGSAFDNVLSIFTKTNEQGLTEEYDYYALVFDTIKTAFGI